MPENAPDFEAFRLTVPVVADMTQAEHALREYQRKAEQAAKEIGEKLGDAMAPGLGGPGLGGAGGGGQRSEMAEELKKNTQELVALREAVEALTEAVQSAVNTGGLP